MFDLYVWKTIEIFACCFLWMYKSIYLPIGPAGPGGPTYAWFQFEKKKEEK